MTDFVLKLRVSADQDYKHAEFFYGITDPGQFQEAVRDKFLELVTKGVVIGSDYLPPNSITKINIESIKDLPK